MKHCDDYIDDPTAPECLRTYLEFARSPGHGLMRPKPHPELYADHNGKRARITMASRFGDLGISYQLKGATSYDLRVAVEELSNFSACSCAYAYDCAASECDERRCMECDAPAVTEYVKTAVRWCPAHREEGKLGHL